VSEDIRRLIQRAGRLRGDRSTTESHWQEVADYIMPSREFQKVTEPGGKRLSQIYHTGPVVAAEQLAGALHGMLTSPALRWFAIRPDDDRIDQGHAVRMWFDAATDDMYRVFTSPNTRFDLHLHEGYLDTAGFGTNVLWVADRGMLGPRFKALPLSESFISENDDGDIDTLFRQFKMRAQDVVMKWGADVPDEMRRRASDRPDDKWECLHAVTPPEKQGGLYEGRYILIQAMKELGQTERYEDRPFVCARWQKRSGEMYGNGPAMNALPDVKELNKLEEENLRGVMLANAPPLMVPDDGLLSPLGLSPRQLNYYRNEVQGIQDRVIPVMTGARPDITAEKIASVEQRVQAAFYTQWMSLPQRPNMTATEVIQRRDEMLRLMGPMVARLQTELLGPIISRTFGIMWRNGMFPAPPPELSGMSWHVEYLSPLAMAQKSSDATQALNFLTALGQIAAGDPTVLDIVDMDEMAQFLADRMGAPVRALRDQGMIDALRQQRVQRDQQMQEMMAAEAATKSFAQGAAGVQSLAAARQAVEAVAA